MSTRSSESPAEADLALWQAADAFRDAPFPVLIGDAGGRPVRFANLAFLRAAGLPASADATCFCERTLAESAAMACDVDTAAVRDLLDDVRRSPVSQASTKLAATAEPVDGEAVCALSAWTIGDDQSSERLVVLALADRAMVDDRRERARTAVQMRAVNERLLLAALREHELTRRAEAANDAKSVFLASISHELRTPLTAIVGYGELLASGISGPVNEEQQLQLARIKMAADHLVSIIDEILLLTTVDTNRQAVEIDRVDVAALVDQTKTIVAPVAKAKGIPLCFETPPGGLTMQTDAMKLRQILVNLLTNAIRYSDRGEVVLRASATNGVVEFEVADQGVGIAPEMQDRIFEPFFQVDQRLTRKVGGIGLGLAICRRLAALLGGDLRVVSTLGEGSVFTLRLPVDLGG